MKKFTYLATALLVLAGAAGCKKNADVQDPELQPSGKMRTVTIQAGQGATKTSVSGGALTWSENDKLYIVPQASGSFTPAALSIKSGVGEASGIFEGQVDASITDATPIYGYCGGDWSYSAGTFSVDMPDTQTYVANGLAENAYPSICSGTIQGGLDKLSNPFGVLKLNVIGASSDLVKSITVTSTANNLAGAFTVVPGGSVSGGSSQTITLGSIPNVALSASGVAFYVVVPAGSYAANDLTITVTKSDDKSDDISLDATTITAGNAIIKNVEVVDKCGGTTPTAGSGITDACGNIYKTIKISNYEIMAENLRCNTYRLKAIGVDESLKGTSLTTSTTNVYTPYYTDGTSQGYGYYYNWAAAIGTTNGQTYVEEIKSEGLCPRNWHMPREDDLSNIANAIEEIKGEDTAGKYLKNSGVGWKYSEGTENLNCYGFSALPAGLANGSSITNVGTDAYFWTLSSSDTNNAKAGRLTYNNDKLTIEDIDKSKGLSIRCIWVSQN